MPTKAGKRKKSHSTNRARRAVSPLQALAYDDPLQLLDVSACYAPISKDLNSPIKGQEVQFKILNQKLVPCADPNSGCTTLRVVARMTSAVSPKTAGEPSSGYPCDALKDALNGTFTVPKLSLVFDSDGLKNWDRRGVHAGHFIWKGNKIVIEGKMAGVSGAGIMRSSGSVVACVEKDDVKTPCAEPCNSPLLHGRLTGVVRTASGQCSHLKNSRVVAVYRISYDPGTQRVGAPPGTSGSGVIEGLMITPCRAAKPR